MPQETDNVQESLRQEFIATRDAYHQKRDKVREQISEHQNAIYQHKQEIGKLEQQVRQERPRVGDAKVECPNCDVISMVYDHMVPGQCARQIWYKCLICAHTDYQT